MRGRWAVGQPAHARASAAGATPHPTACGRHLLPQGEKGFAASIALTCGILLAGCEHMYDAGDVRLSDAEAVEILRHYEEQRGYRGAWAGVRVTVSPRPGGWYVSTEPQWCYDNP